MSARALAIRKALRARYAPPEYVVLEEVRNAAGFAGDRSADALIMSLWPSRGLLLTGVEIKVSRSDWLRELKNPAKAEAIAAYCDHWVIAAPKDMIKTTEVPDGWGLWEVSDQGKFFFSKPGVRNLQPQAIDRAFLAAMLRRVGELDDLMIRDKIEAATLQAKQEAQDQAKREIERSTAEHRQLLDRAKEIKDQTGIDIAHSYRFTDEQRVAIKYALASQRIGGKHGDLTVAISAIQRALKHAEEAMALFALQGPGNV
jgi:hypothetical protein